MDSQNLDDLIQAGCNIQALALIREQFGCSLTEAVDLLNEHHVRLKAEQPTEQPNQRSSADDGGPGHHVGHEDQAVDQRRAADS
ncbi:hypothetical protein JNW91_06740 [Micromonospora sp. STR1_7]|uniref:Ribosomal protein L7/L12 C-terminal domain-containing protein n=1 Tax=Micromonospora parastrephiae TaxID=2806101 RepID=A0ABS1XQQ3_9ACTN|nr:hypothetical protein [Micromonospora parastrephiae]MBM0231586.1 hypothetical protein [Micromonospora parastrephiae]